MSNAKDYRFTKVVAPGWENADQRAYLVVDRETDEPLGRVHDGRLWNIYSPWDKHWKIAHSKPGLRDTSFETREAAADFLWKEHEVPSFDPDDENFLPPGNLVWAANFDHESFFANREVSS